MTNVSIQDFAETAVEALSRQNISSKARPGQISSPDNGSGKQDVLYVDVFGMAERTSRTRDYHWGGDSVEIVSPQGVEGKLELISLSRKIVDALKPPKLRIIYTYSPSVA